MSPHSHSDPHSNHERELRDALVARWGLSADEAARSTASSAIAHDLGHAPDGVRRRVDRRLGPRLKSALIPSQHRTEQVRALLTELLLDDTAAKTGNALALVGPGAGEGRSQLAAELAIAFARLGKRTLLVDVDMRAPTQHHLFPADPNRDDWRHDALGGPTHIAPVAEVPNLWVLAPETTADGPLELLADGRIGSLLREWRRDYDQVILDTPPASKYTDAIAVAKLTGAALIVARQGYTSHREIRTLLGRLAAMQATVVGAVINKF